MSSNKLNITEVSSKCPPFPSHQPNRSGQGRRLEVQAKMERMWLEDPEQFNPNRNCVQRQRVERTVEALKAHSNPQGKRGVDLGCGGGDITRKIRDLGASMDAVDAASQALKVVQEHDMTRIKAIQDCLPETRLNDSCYDIVICTEVIGYLNSSEYRLLFAELSRVVVTDGVVVCSTVLDLGTDNPLGRFAQLADTEFEPLAWILSYHRAFLRFCKGCDKVSTKLGGWMRQNHFMRNVLESISRFFLSEESASHVIFVGKKRPLVFPLPPNEIPVVRPGKRETWG